jgi:hypothetical protein
VDVMYAVIDVRIVVYAVFIFARYVGCLHTTAYWVRCIVMLSLSADYVLWLLHVLMDDLANISRAHAASIFRVELYSIGKLLCMYSIMS